MVPIEIERKFLIGNACILKKGKTVKQNAFKQLLFNKIAYEINDCVIMELCKKVLKFIK